MSEQNCIFCKIIDRSIPATIIAENEDVLVIKDINPKAPIHYLCIPKKHVSDIMSLNDDVTMNQVTRMIQEIGASLPNQTFRLLINNGSGAGQSVFHLHVHLLAGKIMGGF